MDEVPDKEFLNVDIKNLRESQGNIFKASNEIWNTEQDKNKKFTRYF